MRQAKGPEFIRFFRPILLFVWERLFPVGFLIMKLPKILIVDDSSIIRKALSRQLEKFGARVTQAEDGLEGLQRALAGNFDLIISAVELEEVL